MEKQPTFNLRVYAIIVNEKQEVLVSDELRFGKAFTKFPGGGLEWGEGLKDALKRELLEEMELSSEIGELFYVNDFFQKAAFREKNQLFSFYYKIAKIETSKIPVTNHSVPLKQEGEAFRWVPLQKIEEKMFTFPIDKIVAKKLTDKP